MSYHALRCADWSGEWAWGNYPSRETAERDAAGLQDTSRRYKRLLIDPASRTEPPPGEWCIIWKEDP